MYNVRWQPSEDHTLYIDSTTVNVEDEHNNLAQNNTTVFGDLLRTKIRVLTVIATVELSTKSANMALKNST